MMTIPSEPSSSDGPFVVLNDDGDDNSAGLLRRQFQQQQQQSQQHQQHHHQQQQQSQQHQQHHHQQQQQRHSFSSASSFSHSEHSLLRPTKIVEQEQRLSLMFNANKLHFDDIGIVGRDDELRVLSNCLDRLTSCDRDHLHCDPCRRTRRRHPGGGRRRELVMLSGLPGSGKTYLALSVKDKVEVHNGGIFATGKHEMGKGDSPYATMATVCDDLLHGLRIKFINRHSQDPDGSQGTSDGLDDERGDEIILDLLTSKFEKGQLLALGMIVPSIGKLLTSSAAQYSSLQPLQEQQHEQLIDDHRNMINREMMDQSFRTFFRIVSSEFYPVVLLLDDLQWADKQSLALIQVLLLDSCSGVSIGSDVDSDVDRDDDCDGDAFMIIGCYRSDEIDSDDNGEPHDLVTLLNSIKIEQEDDDRLGVTEIHLSDFAYPATNKLLQHVLSMDGDETQDLAMVCQKRTSGNVYFLKEFLSMLFDERLLDFDIGRCQWKWDLNEIEKRTFVTTNIIQLIDNKFKKMNAETIEFLKIAACLGSRFERHIIEMVWHELRKGNVNDSPASTDLDRLVEAAVEERVLEPQLPSAYRFAHDNIQESVIRLMLPEEFQTLQAKIGFLLFRILSKNEAEDFLFVAVDLLNSSGHSSVSIAELNCRAARKAQHLSAFTSASRYIDHGIAVFLSPSIVRWEIDESLALELLSIGAEVELCLGNVEKADYYSRYIIDKEEIKPLDKVRAYRVHSKILYMGGNPHEALKVCLDILSQLGCVFPKGEAARRRQANSMLESTKKMYFSKMDNLADRGFITDLKLLEIVSLLEQGASTALQAKDKAMYILQRCRCVQLILDHGLSNEAASCFASFANVMMHEKGDWTAGVKLAKLALTIQEQLDSKYTETSTCFKTNHLVFGWALPLKSRLRTIVTGYKSGMISGNVEGGCWCLMLAIWCQFYDQTPLDCVSKDCQAYIAKMENLRQINQANITRWTWQLILNFIGDIANPNTSVISGTAIAEEAASSMSSNFCMKTAKLFACAHFGHYATGAKIALEVGESHYEMLSGMAVWGFERFDRAICLYAYGRQTNRRKYIKAAKQVRSRLQEWVSKGAVNLKHLLDILDAEDSALGKDRQKSKSLYEEAIATSARGGFIAHVGLANERYADFLMMKSRRGKSTQNSEDDARYHIMESIKYYTEWKAMKKVSLLRSSWSQLLLSTDVEAVKPIR